MTSSLGEQRAQNNQWHRFNDAVGGLNDAAFSTPVALVDLGAFDANASDLSRRADGVPIRVASKSLRVPALISRALRHPGFSGVLAYTLAEALWLSESKISDDIVVAYPTVDVGALKRLFATPSALAHITLMVDSAEHLSLIDSLWAGRTSEQHVRIALDLDAGLDLGITRVGPRRSPLQSLDRIEHLAINVLERSHLRLVGVMTYEGQVAGVPDVVPGERARSAVVRRIKSASIDQLRLRRAAIAEGLARLINERDAPPLEFWNAGGSGSIESSARDRSVTEVTAGSGLLVPHLFDHFAAFTPRPAAFFGVPVTRRPNASTVTVHGGGLIASGPTGTDRSPLPWAPGGLSLITLEGAGEVQTPLIGTPAKWLQIGDLVWFRHAKSGELFEHTNSAVLLGADGTVDSVSTYRGLGLAF